ncbi:transcriptional regulator family: Centromere protein B DNA-binding region [Penicillium argentinense]|uniref:Transcriptional regulator family: Centromere protein B DNA-binding region n=1 Tax=Penicillium argentinense TaxID=1131581 RepID=A0A9W9K281_9EURO|nr:transcriptional regulator family: Centromere protein B DNA-binding region [Penicillium argentinense]KAJ5090105.1 transcriptional regulator family: Centromere protein B DNA-binding region [Penicillium argentinense]
MPKSPNFDESRMAEAFAAAMAEKKPNLSRIAREFSVSYTTLTSRVKKAKSPITPTKSHKNALQPDQEKALTNWIVKMYSWNLPPTAGLIQAWANRALQRAGHDRQVSKMWAYRFEARLPKHLNLAPVKQKTKELKRIQAEDAGLLQHWYDLLEKQLHDVPARLVYNFDECGFQPGQGRARNVIGVKSSCPDLPEGERGENITAVECIAADGWLMDPLFIFKGSGKNFMEAWYYGSEDLPANTAMSPNGWISDELALAWLSCFIKATATADRLKRGEKRYLIFDGHGAHLTLEFLQRCEDHHIIPFAFLPHSTHLVQPLDNKPFLAYKQKYKALNNSIVRYGGDASDKRDFFRNIALTRKEAFTPSIIRSVFRNCGIWPFNPRVILDKLEAKEPQYPDLEVLGDNTGWFDKTTPPPISSPIDGPTTPRTVQRSTEKLKKRLATENLIPGDLQRMVERLAERCSTASNLVEALQHDLALATAIKKHREKPRSKRQLSDNGMLRSREAKRSIQDRRAREKLAADRKADRAAKKMEKSLPSQQRNQDIWVSGETGDAEDSNDATFVNSFVEDFE